MKKNLVLARETGIILGAALLLGLSYNAFSPKPLPLIRTETTIVASDSLITALATTAPAPPNSTQTAEQAPQQQVSQQQASPQIQSPALTPQSQEKTTNAKSATLAKEPLKTAPQTNPQDSPPQSRKETPSQEQEPKTAAPAKALEIRFDQVEKLLTNPDIILIDARPAREFEQGHIGSAINIYTPEFEQNIGRIIGIPREKPIIAYCGGGACELSHELAENLVKMGFTRVFVYVGGWNEWKQKKL
jgi:rhodanese-related sulfurtransferase